MLIVLIQCQVALLIHQFLHRVFHKLVETLQLLGDESFIVKERGDHRPGVFLGDVVLLVLFFFFFPVVVFVWVGRVDVLIVEICGFFINWSRPWGGGCIWSVRLLERGRGTRKGKKKKGREKTRTVVHLLS